MVQRCFSREHRRRLAVRRRKDPECAFAGKISKPLLKRRMPARACKTESPPKTDSPPKTESPFEKLPTEIAWKIWGLVEGFSNVISIRSTNGDPSTPEGVIQNHALIFKASYKVRVSLHVNRKSRAWALETFKPVLEGCLMGNPVYFHMKLDCLRICQVIDFIEILSYRGEAEYDQDNDKELIALTTAISIKRILGSVSGDRAMFALEVLHAQGNKGVLKGQHQAMPIEIFDGIIPRKLGKYGISAVAAWLESNSRNRHLED